jgi:hypothetical protein
MPVRSGFATALFTRKKRPTQPFLSAINCRLKDADSAWNTTQWNRVRISEQLVAVKRGTKGNSIPQNRARRRKYPNVCQQQRLQILG